MYKYNSNFGAGCPNWAVWADLRFGFVHSTDILPKNYDVFCDQETQLLHCWIARKKIFYLVIYSTPNSFVKENWTNWIPIYYATICQSKEIVKFLSYLTKSPNAADINECTLNQMKTVWQSTRPWKCPHWEQAICASKL